MAKRKKASKKSAKNAPPKAQHLLPSGWWEQVVSIVIGLTAVLLILAIFNLAGPFPQGLLDASRTLFGYSAFVLPLVLIVLTVQKMLSEDNRLSLSVYFGAFVFIASLSSFLHLFVDKFESAQVVNAGKGGGMVASKRPNNTCFRCILLTEHLFIIFTVFTVIRWNKLCCK
jgi:hypothetical protein